MRVDGATPGRAAGTDGTRSERSFAEALSRAASRRAPPRSSAGATADARRAGRARGAREAAGGTQPSIAPDPLAAAAAGPRRGDDPPPVPELAAAIRALPAAISAARPGPAAPLTLTFGQALDVDLRSAPAGVEVVLRPEGRLLAAAQAELPRVVEALRLRGVQVARAEVAPRGGGRRSR